MTYIIYAFVVTVLAAIDQYTKNLVTSYMSLGESINIIPGFFKLTYVQNYGAGFSIMQNATMTFYIITPLCLALFIYLIIKTKKEEILTRIALLLMMGGTIGNFIDRIFKIYVVDFLDFIFFGWDFPVFNFADMCLTVGVFIYVIILLMEVRNVKA